MKRVTLSPVDRLYTAALMTVARQRQKLLGKMRNSTQNKAMDSPLSESSVPLKLSEIQKRCSELMEEPEALTELRLVDADSSIDSGDPYNHLTKPIAASDGQ